MVTNVEAAGGLWVHGLWQEGYHWYCHGLSTMIVQFVIFLWRIFNHQNPRVECNKSASSLTFMRQTWSSTFNLLLAYSCEHQIPIHTWQLLPFFLAATVVTLPTRSMESWIFLILSSSLSSSPFHLSVVFAYALQQQEVINSALSRLVVSRTIYMPFWCLQLPGGVPKSPLQPSIFSLCRTSPGVFFSSRSCWSSVGGPCLRVLPFPSTAGSR